MSIAKLRIIYIAALTILGVLLVFTVFRPMATGGEFSDVGRESIIQSDQEWIIQFDIINYDGEKQNYSIDMMINGKFSSESFALEENKMFTYIRHIYKDQITQDELSFSVYREGEDSPIKQVSYYLK